MLARAVRPTLAAGSRLGTQASFSTSAPAQATLREIETRLKSVRNIEKITKSMKMIASTKLTKAQKAMVPARDYGKANSEIFANAEAQLEEGGKVLYITISSDRGLCGGIHSSVSKATRAELKNNPEAQIVVLGDKPKAQLSRTVSGNIALSFNQVGKDIPTWAEAAAIADMIVKSDIEFDQVNLVYNRFLSAVSYESAITQAFSKNALLSAPGFKAYEVEEEVSQDLAEFALANAIYAALTEGHAAEINARRNAMDNASKNAGDMINRLQMQYNRGRQSTITNELVDIITGASAL